MDAVDIYIDLSGTRRDNNGSQVYVKPSQILLKNPPHVKDVHITSLHAHFSWSQISLLIRHFPIANNTFPQPKTNQKVFEDLHPFSYMADDIQGLRLLLPTYDDISPEVINDNDELETDLRITLNCLVLGDDKETFPLVLQRKIWPQLRYLQLYIHNFNLTHILTLNKTVPKLTYLEIWVPFSSIPDAVWTFDWDSLPFRTGFLALNSDEDTGYMVNVRDKIKSYKIPPINFYSRGNQRIEIDLSYNELESLGYLRIELFSYNLFLNISHNNLQEIEGKDRFNIYTPQMLDLSYNQLGDGFTPDCTILTIIRELYLQNNSFTRPPICIRNERGKLMKIKITDFTSLEILDLSHNFISEINPKYLTIDHHSLLVRISFKGNLFTILPNSVFQATHLIHADFSNNMIAFRNIWSHNVTKSSSSTNTSIFLSGNSISDLDLSELDRPQISGLHNVLENFQLHLDGNPLKCSCKTKRMYNYLLSSSKSERPNETIEILPDFSFYETQWKCIYPAQWAGIPLMQIPEYQYETLCNRLEHCPDKCFCYHSWKLGNIIVANCSHGSNHALSTPRELPDFTFYLNMSNNNLQNLCGVRPYLKNLEVLDLSFNKINKLCPEVLSDLGNLLELNLTRNQLTSLPPEIKLLNNLRSLNFSNNLLEELPKSIQKMTNLQILDISGNRLRCDCDTFWMTGWLLKQHSPITNSENISCFSGKGQGKSLIDLHEYDVGCYDPFIHAVIGLGTAFLLTIILATIIYRYKGHIKIWLYTRFGFHPWDKVKENINEKEYDAFVSYHSNDWDWVLDTLMPQLEEEYGFKLCVHERDFDLGIEIKDNITKAINLSRRTIVILTPEYAKSFWCNLEFLEAKVKAFNEQANYVIVVLLKEVEHKNLDFMLKLYMDTNTYVKFADNTDWFWKKLVYALPKVPIDKLKARNNEETNIDLIPTEGAVAEIIPDENSELLNDKEQGEFAV